MQNQIDRKFFACELKAEHSPAEYICVLWMNYVAWLFVWIVIDTAYQNSVRSLEEARVVWEKEMEVCCNVSLAVLSSKFMLTYE